MHGTIRGGQLNNTLLHMEHPGQAILKSEGGTSGGTTPMRNLMKYD